MPPFRHLIFAVLLKLCVLPAFARDTIEYSIREYPNQEQVLMMQHWLESNEPGSFQFTGLVDPTDDMVIIPRATVSYGYNWIGLSDGPVTVRTPTYDQCG